jgi:DNA replication protein DnaD
MKIGEATEAIRNELNEKINKNDKRVTQRIDTIYFDNLVKDTGADVQIGPDEEKEEFKSLINYTLKNVPEILKRLKKSEDNIG